MSTIPNRTVVLTGASSGIGAAAARALKGAGFDIVAVIRDPKRSPPEARETFRADRLRRLRRRARWARACRTSFADRCAARIVTKLAADPGLASKNGTHFSHRGDVKPDTALVSNIDLQERLWAATAALPAVARLGALE